jgi:6,7-dimethyl-8-ribityllumazine synthase
MIDKERLRIKFKNMQRKKVTVRKTGDASKLKFGIVVSKYYDDITGRMLSGALHTLRAWKVPEKNITILHVSGSYEIPYGCLAVIKKKRPRAVIALGCIIKGETSHDEHIAHAVAQGIMHIQIKYETPIAFGVVTTNNMKQAVVRSTGANNKGIEAATAAIESALL